MYNLIDIIDRYYLDKLLSLKEKGTCLRKKVGAILVRNPFKLYSQLDSNHNPTLHWIIAQIRTNLNKDFYTVCEAFNTSIVEETCENQGHCLMHNGHCIRTLHPEVTCVLSASLDQKLQGWMYISTGPCYKCLQTMAFSGIKRIVVQDLSYWKEDHKDLEPHCRELIRQYDIELVEKI